MSVKDHLKEKLQKMKREQKLGNNSSENDDKTKSNDSVSFETNQINNERKSDSNDAQDNVKLLDIDKIREALINEKPLYNREIINKKKISELAADIKSNSGKFLFNTGLMHPITVREVRVGEDIHYERISGFNRVESFLLNGLKKIPALIVNVDDEKTILVRFKENSLKDNLSTFDEINQILTFSSFKLNITIDELKTLIMSSVSHYDKNKQFAFESYKIKQLDSLENCLHLLGQEIGRTYSIKTLPAKLSLLKIQPVIKEWLAEGRIGETNAREINKIKDEAIILEVLEFCEKNLPTVKFLKEKIKSYNKPKEKSTDNFDKVKNSFMGVSKVKIKKLNEVDKKQADSLLKEILEKVSELQKITEK